MKKKRVVEETRQLMARVNNADYMALRLHCVEHRKPMTGEVAKMIRAYVANGFSITPPPPAEPAPIPPTETSEPAEDAPETAPATKPEETAPPAPITEPTHEEAVETAPEDPWQVDGMTARYYIMAQKAINECRDDRFMTMGKVAKELNDRGLRTDYGKEWKEPSISSYAKKWREEEDNLRGEQ